MKEKNQKEKNQEGYVVRISENALISLFLSAMEAYAVKHLNIKSSSNTSLECIGSLFGHEVKMHSGETLYHIEFATVDTSAEQKRSEVTSSEMATRMKIDVFNSFWPHLTYMGEFHSHPSKSWHDPDRYLSEYDKNDFITDKSWLDIPLRVAIVVAIASMEKAGTKACTMIQSNCVETTFGNLKVWLTAYCVYWDKNKKSLNLTEDKDKQVILDCPSLTGLDWEHVDFGRIKKGQYASNE